MKTRKEIAIKSLIGFFVIFNITVAFHFNPTNEKTQLASLFKKALAESEGDLTICLQTYSFEPNTYFVREKACYRDIDGPDILEGYEGKCNTGGAGCNSITCSTVGICYVQDI